MICTKRRYKDHALRVILRDKDNNDDDNDYDAHYK